MQIKHKINETQEPIVILNDSIKYIGSNVDDKVFFEDEDT